MSLTPYPRLTWPATVPDGPLQAIHNSDRPLCALLAAYAAHRRGAALAGAGRDLPRDRLDALFTRTFAELSLMPGWATRQAMAINGLRLPAAALAAVPPAQRGNEVLTMDPYQVDALERMTCAGGILNMDVGLGKTLTAVSGAAAFALHTGRRARCWIVCPVAAMFDAWMPYVPWLKTFFADVQVLSVDSAHKYAGAARTGGVLILDEAHALGSTDARRTASILKLRPGFDFCLGLTATLVHSGVEKALTVLDVILPGANPFATRWKAGEYFNCLVRTELGQRTVTDLADPSGVHEERFHAVFKPYTVACDKHSPLVRQSVIIPEQTVHTVKLGGEWLSLDDLIVTTATAMHAEMRAADPAAEFPAASAVAHRCLSTGLPAKLDWLASEMDGTPVALFAMYRETLDQVQAWLAERGVSFVRVDGSVVGEARGEAVAKFQRGEADVFLGQMDAAGVAVTLTRANVSVAIDFSSRYVSYPQMLGRTCRRGQPLHCHHFDLVSNALQLHQLKTIRSGRDFSVRFVAALLPRKESHAPTPRP